MIGHLEITCLVIMFCAKSSWTQEDPSSDSGDGKVGKPKCWLTATDNYRKELTKRLEEHAKMIEVTISLEGHPSDMLDHLLHEVFNPHLWIRTTNRQGRNLLMLDDTYRYKSLTTLSLGVAKMEVNVTDQPFGCISGLGQEETLTVIRDAFLRDFKVPGPNSSHEDNKGSSEQEVHICNIQILKAGDYAEFVYRCCQIGFDGSMSCHDLEQDDWVKLLFVLVIIIKVLVVLYIPLLLLDSLYRMKNMDGKYTYRLPEPLTLNAVATQEPDQYGEDGRNKTVRLSRLKNMQHFKEKVASWDTDTIFKIQVKAVLLSVKPWGLLSSDSVPVTVMSLIYKYFLSCQIGRREPLKECCSYNILCCPIFKNVTFKKAMPVVAQICMLSLLVMLRIALVTFYMRYEAPLIEQKTQAASVLGLKFKLPQRTTLSATMLISLFIAVYFIFSIDSCVCGSIIGGVKETLNDITRQCLHDMEERSRLAVLGWTIKLLMLPFRVCRIVGIIFFVPYLVLLSIIILPVIAFYMCSTLNINIRLLAHLFVFPRSTCPTSHRCTTCATCPKRVAGKLEQCCPKLVTQVKEYLNIQGVKANLIPPRNRHQTCCGCIFQLFIITMCIVSFWSVTLLVMRILSFFAELLIYTFMGIVVNTDVTLHYLTVLILVFIYGRNVFSRVSSLYFKYHKVILEQLMSMASEEDLKMAALKAPFGENTAFAVQEEVEANEAQSFSPKIRIKNHKLMLKTEGVLIFLDSCGTTLTPEKFFHKTINLNYYGCPGPVNRNVLRAFCEFLKIVLFLFFVFVIVMALGDAYQISTTNQVLATVAGGFLPKIFKYFFKSSDSVDKIDTSNIIFKTEFNKAINSFKKSWPVFDIIPASDRDVADGGQLQIYVAAETPSSGSNAWDGVPADGAQSSDINVIININEGTGGNNSHAGTESPVFLAADVDIIVDVSESKIRRNLCPPYNRDVERGSMPNQDRNQEDTPLIEV